MRKTLKEHARLRNEARNEFALHNLRLQATIRKAAADGIPKVEIAELTGLSRQTIHTILREET